MIQSYQWRENGEYEPARATKSITQLSWLKFRLCFGHAVVNTELRFA